MMSILFLTLLLTAIFLLVSSFEDSSLIDPMAKLIVYKSAQTNPVVEGSDFRILYQIINVGDGTARRIEIADRYDPNSFESTDGQLTETGAFTFKYDELAPKGNIAFNITVQPKLSGLYESTRARIRYTTGIAYEESEDEVRKGSSSSLGKVRIISKADFARRSEYFSKEWIVYLIVSTLVVVVGFQFWSSSRQQAQKSSATKKKSS